MVLYGCLDNDMWYASKLERSLYGISSLHAVQGHQQQGRNHGWKVEGDHGLGPNTGAFVPRARPETGLGVSVGWGYPSRCGIFENSDAKSCILVASALISNNTCCEISCFLKTTAKKLWAPIHCWSPNLKFGWPVSPVPTVVAPMTSSLCDNSTQRALKQMRNNGRHTVYQTPSNRLHWWLTKRTENIGLETKM